MAFWKAGRYSEVLLDASKVDIIAVASDKTSVLLVITHAFAWTGSDKQVRSLQKKVRAYVEFALDGPMVEANPEIEGLPWQIVIVSKEEMDRRTAGVVANLAEAVRRCGGDLVFRLGPELSLGTIR